MGAELLGLGALGIETVEDRTELEVEVAMRAKSRRGPKKVPLIDRKVALETVGRCVELEPKNPEWKLLLRELEENP